MTLSADVSRASLIICKGVLKFCGRRAGSDVAISVKTYLDILLATTWWRV